MKSQSLAGDQAKVGEPAGELVEDDAGLELAEVSTEAVVQAATEGDVLIGVGTVQIEAIGLGEDRGVAVGRGEPEEQPGAAMPARVTGRVVIAYGSSRHFGDSGSNSAFTGQPGATSVVIVAPRRGG